MSRTSLTVALLLTSSGAALAVEVDCDGPSSTTYEILDGSPPDFTIVYRFYDGSENTRFSNVAAGTDPDAFAQGQCDGLDESRTADSQRDATTLVCFKPPNAESIIPAFPEVAPTDGNCSTAPECRQREWHRALLRELWGASTIEFANCLLDLWQWVNTQQNVPGRRTWWGNDVSEDGECNGRFGSLTGAESILSQDGEYAGTELDDF